MHGYHFSVWKIDLSRGAAARVGLAAELFPRVIGGVGLGTWLLLQDCPRGVNPFDPACPLVFAWGPLTGTGLPGADRFAVVTKSPLTERLNDSVCSSGFAEAGRGAGTDGLVIVGRCGTLSVLVVNERSVRTEPWPELAGLSAVETAGRVRERLGEGYHVAAIGPAGEHGVRFATLSAEGGHAERGGTGAVMGAKRLKAIAVAGANWPAPSDPERLAALAREWRDRGDRDALARCRDHGTPGTLAEPAGWDLLPARDFRAGARPRAEGPRVERLAEAEGVAPALETRFTDPRARAGRMEYENMFSLGPLRGIEAREVAQAAVARCDAHGLDPISTGATLAFVMECGERGLPGVPAPLAALGLRFGDGAALLAAIDAIGRDEPAGRLLGEGTHRLSARIGPESEPFAPHVKGLELPSYDLRSLPSLALGLAVGARGADHSSACDADLEADLAAGDGPLSPESLRAVIEGEERAVLWDSLILGKFPRRAARGDDDWAELLRAVTGVTSDGAALRESARLILDLKKLFNQRQGWTMAEDQLPDRFFIAENGRPGLDRARFREAVRSYYRERGWDAEGRLAD
jgi:aldehyde:ferredoxin oxidoreductase